MCVGGQRGLLYGHIGQAISCRVFKSRFYPLNIRCNTQPALIEVIMDNTMSTTTSRHDEECSFTTTSRHDDECSFKTTPIYSEACILIPLGHHFVRATALLNSDEPCNRASRSKLKQIGLLSEDKAVKRVVWCTVLADSPEKRRFEHDFVVDDLIDHDFILGAEICAQLEEKSSGAKGIFTLFSVKRKKGETVVEIINDQIIVHLTCGK